VGRTHRHRRDGRRAEVGDLLRDRAVPGIRTHRHLGLRAHRDIGREGHDAEVRVGVVAAAITYLVFCRHRVLLERRDASASCEPVMAAASPPSRRASRPVSSCAYMPRVDESSGANTLNLDSFDRRTTLDLAGSNDMDRTRSQTVRARSTHGSARSAVHRATSVSGAIVALDAGSTGESRRQRSCRIHSSPAGAIRAGRCSPRAAARSRVSASDDDSRVRGIISFVMTSS
jgi:hypothetical protein